MNIAIDSNHKATVRLSDTGLFCYFIDSTRVTFSRGDITSLEGILKQTPLLLYISLRLVFLEHHRFVNNLPFLCSVHSTPLHSTRAQHTHHTTPYGLATRKTTAAKQHETHYYTRHSLLTHSLPTNKHKNRQKYLNQSMLFPMTMTMTMFQMILSITSQQRSSDSTEHAMILFMPGYSTR